MPSASNKYSARAEESSAAYAALRETMTGYATIGEATWQAMRDLCALRQVAKGETLVRIGEIPRSFFFVYRGLLRAFIIGGADGGREINKNFFDEGRFPASITALLTGRESEFCIAALEDSVIVEIDHARYRRLLEKSEELKMYHIAYLERHWVLEKEPQEVSLLQNDAKIRYAEFMKANPDLARRIPLHHIASRLGITPTQLSRIRKRDLEKDSESRTSQHM